MKSKPVIVTLLFILCASGIALHAATVAATVENASGNVYATEPSGKSIKLKDGDTVPVGSLIHTNADSSCRLKLVPGATTVVTPGTDITLSTLDYSQATSGAKTRKVKLTLQSGQLLCSLAKHDGNSDFKVSTPDGVAAARGTDWAISFSASAGVSVSTADGTVTLTLPNGHAVSVPGGQVTTSPDGVTTVTGKLTSRQVMQIQNAIKSGNGAGGGTFTITPVNNTNNSNPANRTQNPAISPTE